MEVVRSVLAQAQVKHRADHRPWPLPDRPWLMAQSWKHLLFAHWPVPVATLRPTVPDALPIDTFAGQAWVAVTPFQVHALRLHGTPPVPYISSFLETNVRTYVTLEGKPGIYFFSLDAASKLAVAAARRAYRLPYFPARMSIARERDQIRYETRREQADAPPAELIVEYEPTGPTFTAEPGSLEHWLTERYCLYTLDDQGRVLLGEIHHPAWSLRTAAADLALNTMLDEIGVSLGEPALLHLAERQDVIFWRLSRVAAVPS